MGLPIETMSPREIEEAQIRVAMKSVDQFMRWIEASDRNFLIFVAKDLLHALPSPQDAELVQQLNALYRAHRNGIAYDTRKEVEPITGETIEVAICKDDRLTLAEKDRLVRQLAGDLADAVPGWSLDSDPIG